MKSFIRSFSISLFLIFAVAACSDDSSISSSGAGSLASDGGASSAQYAGTYTGTTYVRYQGDGIDDEDNFPTTVVVNDNGTVSVTIEGETVDGTINSNKLEVGIKLTREEDGVTCTGTMLIKATIDGTSMSGPVDGDAECKLFLISRSATMTGTLTANK